MTNHIIETIGKEGIKTSDIRFRINKPGPGDKVYFSDGGTAQFGRIDTIDVMGIKGLVSICDNGGSVFLNQSGTVSISGGPFRTVLLEDLTPRGTLETVSFWNWGDNSPGAGQGVYYSIARPVFDLTPQDGAKDKIQALFNQAIAEDEKARMKAAVIRKAAEAKIRETTQPYNSTWSETTEDWYIDMLEVLPPEKWEKGCFMVGEPTTHGDRGAVHAAYAKVDNRYFCKDDYVMDFDPARYKAEIKDLIANPEITPR